MADFTSVQGGYFFVASGLSQLEQKRSVLEGLTNWCLAEFFQGCCLPSTLEVNTSLRDKVRILGCENGFLAFEQNAFSPYCTRAEVIARQYHAASWRIFKRLDGEAGSTSEFYRSAEDIYWPELSFQNLETFVCDNGHQHVLASQVLFGGHCFGAMQLL